jgi:hypothetical protein
VRLQLPWSLKVATPALNPLQSPATSPKATLGSAKIGQTFTYEDGLKVSVVSAKKDTAGRCPIEGTPGAPPPRVRAARSLNSDVFLELPRIPCPPQYQ